MRHDNPIPTLSHDDMNEGEFLYVRSATGRYKVATDAQVLAAARVAAESLIAGCDLIDKPQTVKAYFRAKLGSLGHEAFAVLFLDNQLKVTEAGNPRYCQQSQDQAEYGCRALVRECPADLVDQAANAQTQHLVDDPRAVPTL